MQSKVLSAITVNERPISLWMAAGLSYQATFRSPRRTRKQSNCNRKANKSKQKKKLIESISILGVIRKSLDFKMIPRASSHMECLEFSLSCFSAQVEVRLNAVVFCMKRNKLDSSVKIQLFVCVSNSLRSANASPSRPWMTWPSTCTRTPRWLTSYASWTRRSRTRCGRATASAPRI